MHVKLNDLGHTELGENAVVGLEATVRHLQCHCRDDQLAAVNTTGHFTQDRAIRSPVPENAPAPTPFSARKPQPGSDP